MIFFVQFFCVFLSPSSAYVSLVAQRLKCLPAMRETWVWSLGQEDPLERKWQPTPVFLPGESHGQRSLVGYSPRGPKESDMTERLNFHFLFTFVYSCHLLLLSSASVKSIPFLCFIEPIFAWNVPLVSLIFLKRSLVFPILLFSSISLQWSLRKTFLSLLAILWNSAFKLFSPVSFL